MRRLFGVVESRLPASLMLAFILPLMSNLLATTPMPGDMRTGFLLSVGITGLWFGNVRHQSPTDQPRIEAQGGLRKIRRRSLIVIGGCLVAYPVLAVLFATGFGALMILMTALVDLVEGVGVGTPEVIGVAAASGMTVGFCCVAAFVLNRVLDRVQK